MEIDWSVDEFLRSGSSYADVDDVIMRGICNLKLGRVGEMFNIFLNRQYVGGVCRVSNG